MLTATEQHVRREKAKAKELRASRWWQTLIAEATCYYCERATAKDQATMDHVVPLSQGGKSTPGNIVVACKACNTAKGGLTAVEWTLLLEERRSHAAAASAERHHVRDDG